MVTTGKWCLNGEEKTVGSIAVLERKSRDVHSSKNMMLPFPPLNTSLQKPHVFAVSSEFASEHTFVSIS